MLIFLAFFFFNFKAPQSTTQHIQQAASQPEAKEQDVSSNM